MQPEKIHENHSQITTLQPQKVTKIYYKICQKVDDWASYAHQNAT